jgi:twitching motility protein PilT
MSLVPSLLQAIVQLDGEALVLHVGEKPYVVAPTGQVDLATRGLSLEAVVGIVNQLLPIESQQALDEFGAAQHELSLPDFPGEHFTIVAARGGDDVWAEVRRRHVSEDDRVPMELFADPGASVPAQGYASVAPALESDEAFETPAAPPMAASIPVTHDDDDLFIPDGDQLFPDSAPADDVEPEYDHDDLTLQPEQDAQPADAPVEIAAEWESPEEEPRLPPPPVFPPAMAQPVFVAPAPPPAPTQTPAPALTAPPLPPPPVPMPALAAAPAPRREAPPVVASAPPEPRWTPAPAAPSETWGPAARLTPPPVVPAPAPEPPRWTAPAAAAPPAPEPRWAPPVAAPPVESRWAPVPPPPVAEPRYSPPPPGVVLPLARNPIRPDAPPPLAEQALAGLDRLLRLAAARGASTLYLSSASRPSVRVDGDIYTLDGAPVLGPNDVESLLLTLMPERSAEALRTGVASEWICDLPDVGRVRCMSFRDHRGPGGVFRMMPSRAVTADQLGLSREIQALAIEPEGLLLVSGPRSSGKRTLMSALIDLINRTRRDHVISIESEINVVHERNGSFISQREVRGGIEEMVAVARAALREDPDILVLEELRSPALMNLALDAAGSGQLVIGGFPAHDAPGAVDRIIDLYPPEYRRQVQLSLAQNLRGVVAQVLLRKNGGGRVAAREVLLNTPAVAGVLAEGRTSQLPLAIEGGRRQGMVPLNDALVGFVQSGAVDVREAYRRAADRTGFLALLKRQGVDTSPIERYA